MELGKDMYEYLTNFADDKDILNMLSVNKKFRDEKFFERVMIRRYPNMINFKRDNDSWKSFFIKTIYYVSKLKEEYGIDSRFIKINPIYFYKSHKKYAGGNIYSAALRAAQENLTVNTNDMMKFVQLMITKGGDHNVGLNIAIQRDRLDVAKELLEKGAIADLATRAAVRGNNIKGLKFIFDETGNLHKNEALLSAASSGKLDLLKFIIESGATDFRRAYENAKSYDNKEILEYLRRFL